MGSKHMDPHFPYQPCRTCRNQQQNYLIRDTVRKMPEYSVPPGYRRQSPPRRPKLDPYRGHGVTDKQRRPALKS